MKLVSTLLSGFLKFCHGPIDTMFEVLGIGGGIKFITFMWDMRVDMLRWNIIIRILLKFSCKHKNSRDPYILDCIAQHVYGSQQARPRLKHWDKIQWSMNSLRGKEIYFCEIFLSIFA